MNQTIVQCGESRVVNSEYRQMLAGANILLSTVTPENVVTCEDEQLSPCCLLIGESLNAAEVAQVLERVLSAEICLTPVVIADNPDTAFVVCVMKLGAFNVVSASEHADALQIIVDEALSYSSLRLSEMNRHQEIVSRINKLSARQKEVMAFVVDGASNKTIAAELHLSPKTIEVHRASVMRKMKARSLPDLVKFSLTQFTMPHSAVALASPIPAERPTTNEFAE